MTDFGVGCVARSLAGHDRGNIFIIVREETEYVYLADGKTRTADRPKRKKRKHVQCSGQCDRILAEKLKAGQRIYDEQIRYFIKSLRQGGRENVEGRCN